MKYWLGALLACSLLSCKSTEQTNRIDIDIKNETKQDITIEFRSGIIKKEVEVEAGKTHGIWFDRRLQVFIRRGKVVIRER